MQRKNNDVETIIPALKPGIPPARYPASSILALLLLLLSHPACSRIFSAESAAQAGETLGNVPTVLVMNPRIGDMEQVLALPGTLLPYEEADLFSKITGYIEAIAVDIGDPVRKGGVLAVLIVPEMETELQRVKVDVPAARSRLDRARAEEELAALTHERLAGLYEVEPGAVTAQEVDMARAHLKSARAQVGIAKADLNVKKAEVSSLEALLAYSQIEAPFDGVITKRNDHPGALSRAGVSDQEPILHIARTDRLRMAFDIREKGAPYIQAGQKVEFTIDSIPGKLFEGIIARTSEVLTRDTRNMRSEVDIQNDQGRFRPGMYAKVKIPFRTVLGALSLPAAALRSKEGTIGVLTVEKGVVHWIPVTLLMDDGARVVVQGNLNQNSAVILAGPPLLGEGSIVQAQTKGSEH